MSYFIATLPTPLFNRHDLADLFDPLRRGLPLDQKKLFRPLEMIAFAQTAFKIVDQTYFPVCLVETTEYPSSVPLYLDVRFGKVGKEPFPTRIQKRPSKDTIIEQLLSYLGSCYIWGGNQVEGVAKMAYFYPPPLSLSPSALTYWMFRGFDCSGLLYRATEGTVPRNTCDLLSFGRGIPIEGLNMKDIIEQLLPLDYIVWPGHVVIVLDQSSVIESHHGRGGVVRLPLKERLAEIMRNRYPANHFSISSSFFLVRRFLGC